MNLSNMKRLLKKYYPVLLIFIVVILIIVVSINSSKETSFKIFITLFIASVVFRVILGIISKSNQVIFPIKNKVDAINAVYDVIDFEDMSTIVVINTKNEDILENAKKLFPGAQEQKQKDLYSVMLPKANDKNLTAFLKKNDVERIIIHSFKKDENKTNTISICIDKKLIIQYSKNLLEKNEINSLKNKISESK